ncbi:hypothetical protein L596_015703 [Steinernema carpocapsae]|uniref:Uncharacterized protein n=1 Tax=Steinernema carpocapsae TaxID=34508 RepID=A0A4U5NGM4_STECR|nr:hypothetical protein L596_015703 [Steinernema carpocapsae]
MESAAGGQRGKRDSTPLSISCNSSSGVPKRKSKQNKDSYQPRKGSSKKNHAKLPGSCYNPQDTSKGQRRERRREKEDDGGGNTQQDSTRKKRTHEKTVAALSEVPCLTTRTIDSDVITAKSSKASKKSSKGKVENVSQIFVEFSMFLSGIYQQNLSFYVLNLSDRI